jgi:hypothetical protein
MYRVSFGEWRIFFIVQPSVISLNVVAPEKFYNIGFSAAECFLSLTGQKTEKKNCLKKCRRRERWPSWRRNIYIGNELEKKKRFFCRIFKNVKKVNERERKKIGKWFRFLRLHLIHNWSECLDYKPFYTGSKLACLLHVDICAFRTTLGAYPVGYVPRKLVR